MADYGSALIPDFQEHYHLRLSEVVTAWHPVEVITLIHGLPARSRFFARLQGEESGEGFSATDWLALDTRNALEGLRATVTNLAAGKDKKDFRQWDTYPGAKALAEQRIAAKMESIRSLAKVVDK